MEKDTRNYLEKGLKLEEEWEKWIADCPINAEGGFAYGDRTSLYRWIDKKPEGKRPSFGWHSVREIKALLGTLRGSPEEC